VDEDNVVPGKRASRGKPGISTGENDKKALYHAADFFI